MHAYRFRILTDDQEDFIRDVEVKANQTFLDFHDFLVRLFEFNAGELASFSVCNSKWYKLCEITLIDMKVDAQLDDEDDEFRKPQRLKTFLMAEARMRDFIEDPHQRMVYEYDFLKIKTFYLELTKILPADTNIQYPRCIHSEGVLFKKPVVLHSNGLNEDIPDLADLDFGDDPESFEEGIDDSFLASLSDGFEIEQEQSIGFNVEEAGDSKP